MSNRDVSIKAEHAFVADEQMKQLPSITREAVKKTILFYVSSVETKKDPSLYRRLETVLLSQIYSAYGCE